LGLCTDEGASVQREAALPESSKDRKITYKHQKADLTPFCGRRYSPASPRCLDLTARRRRVGQVRQETKVRARGGRRHQRGKFVAPNTWARTGAILCAARVVLDIRLERGIRQHRRHCVGRQGIALAGLDAAAPLCTDHLVVLKRRLVRG